MSKRYGTIEERLERDTIPEPMSGCWLWVGHDDGSGYGRVRVGNARPRAHVVSYELHKGPVPSGLILRHRCDTRCCVNPDHLEVGTIADNIADMDKRGRRSLGENHNAKLTEADVRAIRANKDGLGVRALGRKYGISHGIIIRIRDKIDWKHVK